MSRGKWHSVQSALIAHQIRPLGLAKWTLSKLETSRASVFVGRVGALGFDGVGVGEAVGVAAEGVAGVAAGGVTAHPASHPRASMATRNLVSALGRWLGAC